MKTIGSGIRIFLFAIAVLVLGSVLHWRGRTVSDQVQTQVAHAERSETAAQLKKWTSEMTQEVTHKAKESAKKAWGKSETRNDAKKERPSAERPSLKLTKLTKPTQTQKTVSQVAEHQQDADATKYNETIAPTERQKLRALIEELNGSQAAVKTADRESN